MDWIDKLAYTVSEWYLDTDQWVAKLMRVTSTEDGSLVWYTEMIFEVLDDRIELTHSYVQQSMHDDIPLIMDLQRGDPLTEQHKEQFVLFYQQPKLD